MGYRDAGFSASNHFYVLRRDGTVNVHSPSGVRLWTAQLPESADAALSADGDCVMAYYDRNPADSSVTFIDSTGSPIWQTNVDGAVWCADSCKSDRASRFFVGTGKGRVYVIDVGERAKRYRRWRMPGAVVSLGADGDTVVAASWQRSAVRMADDRGRKAWEVEGEPTGVHLVRPLDGRVLVEFSPTDARADGSYEVLDSSGQRLFGGVVSVDECTRVIPAPGGRYVCTGVCRLITHKGKSMRERHTVLMDDSGRVLWEKGSPFFQAVPLAVTRTGYVVISDGKSSIFLISPAGEMRPALKVHSPVRDCIASRDGSRLLLDCRDGTLVLVQVTG